MVDELLCNSLRVKIQIYFHDLFEFLPPGTFAQLVAHLQLLLTENTFLPWTFTTNSVSTAAHILKKFINIFIKFPTVVHSYCLLQRFFVLLYFFCTFNLLLAA